MAARPWSSAPRSTWTPETDGAGAPRPATDQEERAAVEQIAGAAGWITEAERATAPGSVARTDVHPLGAELMHADPVVTLQNFV